MVPAIFQKIQWLFVKKIQNLCSLDNLTLFKFHHLEVNTYFPIATQFAVKSGKILPTQATYIQRTVSGSTSQS